MTKRAQGKLSNPKQEVDMTQSRVNESLFPIWLLVSMLFSWLARVRKFLRNLQYTAVKDAKLHLVNKWNLVCVAQMWGDSCRCFLQLNPITRRFIGGTNQEIKDFLLEATQGLLSKRDVLVRSPTSGAERNADCCRRWGLELRGKSRIWSRVTCCNGEASVWRFRGNKREDSDAKTHASLWITKIKEQPFHGK